MKHRHAPKYCTQLSDSWVLWFEASNQYLVISKALKEVLEVFLISESELDFENHLKTALNLPKDKSKAYYIELNEFLEAANFSPKEDATANIDLTIPNTNITETYSFNAVSITVNYSSLNIQNLIHPQWAHTTNLKEELATTVFDIFQKENELYLFKDKKYIGHYGIRDYHLLQGQFALQLINTLYHKTESDWLATFHASTVCNDNEAIMIIGDSGNGKSTLSAVLMAAGYDVLADDFSPLSAHNQELYRFPSGISVKQGAFKTLEPLFQDFEHYPQHKSTSKPVTIKYIPPIKGFGEAKSHLPCKKIVYVKYDAQATSELKSVGIDKILSTLIPESWLSPLPSNAERFLDWLKEVQCFELNYSDNNRAVSQFKKLFTL